MPIGPSAVSPQRSASRPTLVFPRRPTRDDTITFRRWRWTARNAGISVERLVSKFGMPDQWTVLTARHVQGGTWWDIVARHRTRRMAFRHAESLFRAERRGEREAGRASP